jgi:branched-chain amino acid transport system permease protein
MSLQMLVNAILLGGLYALMGLGFSLQWGISGIVNLSYGAMVILGSYISLECFDLLHLDPFVSMIISGVILYALGGLIYRTLLQRVVRGGIVFTLILTYAVRLITENGLLRVWSADYRTIRVTYAGNNFQFAGAAVPLVKCLVFVVVAVLVYLTYCFMMKTKIGKGIQAVALDTEGAQAVGISVEKMYLVNFALGTALAGIAGSLWASVYTFSPDSINMITGKVFIIAILGGLGNIWGAAAGGLLLGLAETVGATLVGSQWQEVIGMAIMVIVLLWRPYGLLGKKFFG